MLTIIDFLSNSILYGFGLTTIVLYVLRRKGDSQTFDIDTVIKANNVLVLIRTLLLLLSVVGSIFSAWYSSTEYEQFDFTNRWTGSYSIFLWTSILLAYFPSFLMLSQRNWSSLAKSIFIVTMWIINYLVYLFLAKLLINPTDWTLIIKPDYYTIAKGMILYFFLLIALTYSIQVRSARG